MGPKPEQSPLRPRKCLWPPQQLGKHTIRDIHKTHFYTRKQSRTSGHLRVRSLDTRPEGKALTPLTPPVTRPRPAALDPPAHVSRASNNTTWSRQSHHGHLSRAILSSRESSTNRCPRVIDAAALHPLTSKTPSSWQLCAMRGHVCQLLHARHGTSHDESREQREREPGGALRPRRPAPVGAPEGPVKIRHEGVGVRPAQREGQVTTDFDVVPLADRRLLVLFREEVHLWLRRGPQGIGLPSRRFELMAAIVDGVGTGVSIDVSIGIYARRCPQVSGPRDGRVPSASLDDQGSRAWDDDAGGNLESLRYSIPQHTTWPGFNSLTRDDERSVVTSRGGPASDCHNLSCLLDPEHVIPRLDRHRIIFTCMHQGRRVHCCIRVAQGESCRIQFATSIASHLLCVHLVRRCFLGDEARVAAA